MNKRIQYAEPVVATRNVPANVLDVPWTVASENTALAPQTPAQPPAATAATALTRPELLTWLYTPTAPRPPHRPALDRGALTILTAQTLQHPVEWVELLDAEGRFVRVAYAVVQLPDPDLILALDPHNAAFVAAMGRFQRVRTQAPTWGWSKWYQSVMSAARDLLEPLLALGPTADEARFVLRWTALVAATGRQYGVVG